MSEKRERGSQTIHVLGGYISVGSGVILYPELKVHGGQYLFSFAAVCVVGSLFSLVVRCWSIFLR